MSHRFSSANQTAAPSLSFSAASIATLSVVVTLGDVFFSSAGFSPVSPETVLVTSNDGVAQLALCAGLWCLFLVAALSLLRAITRADVRGVRGLYQSNYGLILFNIVLFALATNQTFSSGRQILAIGVLLPGSLLTRLFQFTNQPWIDRLFEPGWWWWLFSLELLAQSHRPLKSQFRLAELLIVILILVEVAILASYPPFGLILESQFRLISWGHYLLLFLTLVVQTQAVRHTAEFHPEAIRLRVLIKTAAVATIILLFSFIGVELLLVSRSQQISIGAHYYSWFPENWAHGYSAKQMQPRIVPELGEYSLREHSVFLQHEWWAREAGINYFIIDWWPTRVRLQRRIREYLANAEPYLSQIKISLHYEFLDLRQIDKRAITGEPSYVVTLTDARVNKFAEDMVTLAREMMIKPYFLRIHDRPVVFIYATRHVLGDVRSAVEFVRSEVRKATGLELFLIADEAFYQVLFDHPQTGHRLGRVDEVNWERLLAFDGITSYNPYETSRSLYGGEEGADLFLRDVSVLYGYWAKVAATANLLFVPTALPGYNDRGVRLSKNHYVVPRRVGDEWFIRRSLDSWVRPFLDRRAPVAAITSWNEWNEGTMIEPSNVSEPTTEDASSSTGSEFPSLSYAGEQFAEGYGCTQLEEVQRFLTSR